jgi:hypothetical protein
MIKALGSAEYAVEATRVEETSLTTPDFESPGGKQRGRIGPYLLPPLVRMKVYSLEAPAVRNISPRYFSLGSGI